MSTVNVSKRHHPIRLPNSRHLNNKLVDYLRFITGGREKDMSSLPKLAAAGLCLATFITVALLRNAAGTPNDVDLHASAHWVLDPSGINANTVADRAGKLPGTITGSPTLSPDGLVFSGPADGVTLHPAAPADAAILPKAAFTIVAQVRIDQPQEWGGILGCFQDNGPTKRGFVLGFDKSSFFLGLASVGGNERMTYLSGKTAYRLGQWYHVAATYDGRVMRLFVNGEEDGISVDQSGPVRYADKAPFVIGRYTDDNEDFGLTGAIRDVQLIPSAVPAEKIAAHFRANQPPAASPADTVKFVIEPYLQYVTRTGITVMAETDVPAACTVEYGLSIPLSESVKVEKPDAMHEVKLTGLQPKTRYVYRVVCTNAAGKRLESKYLTFMTAVDADDAWSFAVIGDTQKNPKITGKVAKGMWERRPHFVLHNGDVVDNGRDKKEWTDELFKPCNDLFGRVACFPTIGNHEKNDPQYYKYFSLPAPEYYYSYTYGNAEFFSLDTNKRVGPGTEQYQWLEKALAASTATWKICYHHHPCYSSDSDDFGDTFKLS